MKRQACARTSCTRILIDPPGLLASMSCSAEYGVPARRDDVVDQAVGRRVVPALEARRDRARRRSDGGRRTWRPTPSARCWPSSSPARRPRHSSGDSMNPRSRSLLEEPREPVRILGDRSDRQNRIAERLELARGCRGSARDRGGRDARAAERRRGSPLPTARGSQAAALHDPGRARSACETLRGRRSRSRLR